LIRKKKSYCENYCKKRFEKSCKILACIEDLDHCQVELILLRYSYSFFKIVYLIRTTPIELIENFVRDFDRAVLKTFGRIIGDIISDENAISQVRLPIKLGGFGLRSGCEHASAAYGNSYGHFKGVKVEDQKSLSLTIDNNIRARLWEEGDDDTKFRLDMICREKCASWISDMPAYGLGLEWDNEQFRCLCRWWLGLKQSVEGPCAFCAGQMTPKGRHALVCRGGGDLVGRHHNIRDGIFQIARDACLNPVKEKGDILGDEPGKRPGDVYLPSFNGNSWALDIAVTGAVYGTYPYDRDCANTYAKNIKLKKYAEGFAGASTKFVPVVFDSFGGVSTEGGRMIEDIVRECAGRKPEVPKSILWRKILHSLHFHNSRMFLRRCLEEVTSKNSKNS